MNIPTLFSSKEDSVNFEYKQIESLVDTEIDNYNYIDNLSVPLNKKELCRDYYKSIIL